MPPRVHRSAQQLSPKLEKALKEVPVLIARMLASPSEAPKQAAEQLLAWFRYLIDVLTGAEDVACDLQAIQLLNALGGHKDFLASMLQLLATGNRMPALGDDVCSYCACRCMDFLVLCWHFAASPQPLAAAGRDAVLRSLLAVGRMGTFQALARQAADATAALLSHTAGGSSSHADRDRMLRHARVGITLGTDLLDCCVEVLTKIQEVAQGGGLPAAVAAGTPSQGSGNGSGGGNGGDRGGGGGGGGGTQPAQLLGLADFYR